jgi:hypothetical protein
MSKQALKTIVTLTFVVWLIGTVIYSFYSIAPEYSQANFFPTFVMIYFLFEQLPFLIFFLMFAIILELTVWAVYPVKVPQVNGKSGEAK